VRSISTPELIFWRRAGK